MNLHSLRLKSPICFELMSYSIFSKPKIIWNRSKNGTGETKCIENSSVVRISFSIESKVDFSMTIPCVSFTSLSIMLKEGCIGCSSLAPSSKLITARDVRHGGCFF